MSIGLHNIALPVLKWAHKETSTSLHRSKLSDPSSEPNSDDPNQEPTQQEVVNADVVDVEADDPSGKPWNLRSRKSVSAQTPPYQTIEAVNLYGGVHRNERREKKKPKLFISLTKEEIEEDLYSMTGSKATQRPKKRTKAVQKLLDNVFPGLGLDGTSADTYRVQHSS